MKYRKIFFICQLNIESNGAREFYSRALRELDVTVDRNPAPIVQSWLARVANGQIASAADETCSATIAAPSGYSSSIFCISGMPI